MKNSSKISTLIVGLLALGTVAKAQTSTAVSTALSSTGTILSIGTDGGFSAGSFKKNNRWNWGGSIQADIPVADRFYFTANAGYSNFYGRTHDGVSAPDIHLLPVKAGLRYFPIGVLYVQADAGAAFALNKSNVGYDKTAAFIYTPQVGVELPLGGKSYLDAGAVYEASTKFSSGINNSKVNYFGLHLAYGFSIK